MNVNVYIVGFVGGDPTNELFEARAFGGKIAFKDTICAKAVSRVWTQTGFKAMPRVWLHRPNCNRPERIFE